MLDVFKVLEQKLTTVEGIPLGIEKVGSGINSKLAPRILLYVLIVVS